MKIQLNLPKNLSEHWIDFSQNEGVFRQKKLINTSNNKLKKKSFGNYGELAIFFNLHN